MNYIPPRYNTLGLAIASVVLFMGYSPWVDLTNDSDILMFLWGINAFHATRDYLKASF